jgi:hypothetical protein
MMRAHNLEMIRFEWQERGFRFVIVEVEVLEYGLILEYGS